MKEVDLKNYPSKIEFSHKIEDLKDIGSIEDISTVGRIFNNQEGEFFLYHNGSNVRIDFLKETNEIEVGDVIKVRGNYGGKEKPIILVEETDLCSKCVQKISETVPLEKYGGLNLLLNNEKRETILLKSKIFKKTREFLDNKKFIEVETPILQYYPDSAPVPTFSTKFSENDHEYHLRICPEEYLKRLTLGLDRVYEIGKCFRNSDNSIKHSSEFTMLEFYGSFLTYENTMDLTEELIEKLALDLKGKTELDFNGYKIDVKRPWKRISVRDASLQTYSIDPIELNNEELKKFLGVKEDLSRDKLLTIFIEEKLENLFIQPTFLTNYPIGVGAPDKTNIKDILTTERTEVFIAKGFELANLGSINNDPEFLKKHNIQNLINKYGKKPDSEKYLDIDFLYEMGFGIPPLACCGIGMDRLTMLLSNKGNINETIIYPFKNQNEY